MQVAFTAPGLEAWGSRCGAGWLLSEFLDGMTEASRSRRLGDVESNAPSRWDWGHAPLVPHLLVMLFARPGYLDGCPRARSGDSWHAGFEELRRLTTGHLDGVEPFGFIDGISQPAVDWEQQRDPSEGANGYSNVVALGEFLLGYRNEYAKYTDRPLIDADARPPGCRLPKTRRKRGLGRNGTYLVMRQLKQDVRGFWQFVISRAGEIGRRRKRWPAARRPDATGRAARPAPEGAIPGIGEEAGSG